MDRKQLLKTGIHLIPALLTIALILGCASRPDLEKIPEKLKPEEEEIVMETEEEQEVGEGIFHVVLHRAAQRARAHRVV